MTCREIINSLELIKHPEGGYYKETYRSDLVLETDIRSRFVGSRNICTSIYFLMPSSERSVLHRIKSDEIWNFHAGSTFLLYVIDHNGVTIHKLGSHLREGESFQVVVPANTWFGGLVKEKDTYSLCGCTVAPGFDFRDFEIGKRSDLLNIYPQFEKEIVMLTNP